MSPSTVLSPTSGAPGPTVVEVIGRGASRCRCGTHLAPGNLRLELHGVPPNVRGIFEGQVFCSHRCVRAIFLESMETFDGLTDANRPQIVSDLHSTYLSVAQTFAKLLEQPNLAA